MCETQFIIFTEMGLTSLVRFSPPLPLGDEGHTADDEIHILLSELHEDEPHEKQVHVFVGVQLGDKVHAVEDEVHVYLVALLRTKFTPCQGFRLGAEELMRCGLELDILVLLAGYLFV